MLRLQRQQNKASKSGERIDFKFSNFQALQVPKGWDKLFVSIISVETGKTITKSNKALVRNGSCQWAETLTESIWISQDDSSKELEECLFKLVVSMGSARSGILGEATVNMAGYMSSKAIVPISLPLKKCPYGTLLQVKIHCLTPITKFREEVSNSHVEDQNADHQDMEIRSNKSDNSFSRSNGSSSSKDLGFPSHPREPRSRGTSFSASGLHHRSDSADTFIEKETFSPRNSNSPRSDHLADDPYRSNQSSFNSRLSGSRNDNYQKKHGKEFEKSSSLVIASSSSSKNLLEAAEDTIEELRLESKKWERNARKLMVDMEVLKMELFDQSKKQANLDMELSMAYMERDEFKNEVEKMKLTLEELTVKRKSEEVLNFQAEGGKYIRKELENEIKFQKESNADLALQLSRSQESNIELVDVLQELEETIEKQKVEIDNLSVLQLKVSDLEKTIEGNSEENRKLSVELEKLQESEKKLINNVELLEKALEERNNEEEKLRQSLEKESSERKNLDSARVIEALKGKLQELERDCSELTDENLELLLKLKDLEDNPVKECVLFDSVSEKYQNLFEQLKMAFYHVNKPWYNVSSHVNNKFELNLGDFENETNIDTNVLERWADTTFNYFIELNKLLEEKIAECEEVVKNYEEQIKERNEKVIETQKKLEESMLKENNLQLSIRDLGKEMDEKRFKIEKLEENLLSKDEEIGSLRQWRNEKVIETQKKQEEYVLKEINLQLSIRDLGKEMDEKRFEIEKLEENLLSKDEEIESLRRWRNEKVIETRKNLEQSVLKENNLQLSIRNLGKEMDEKRSEIVKLEENLLSKDEEIESLRQWKKEKVIETRKKLEESVSKENNLQLSIQDLRKEMDAKRSVIEKLEENLQSKDEEIESLRRWRNENIIETRRKLEESVLKENNLQLSVRDLGKEMDEKRSEIEKLEENLLSKDEEIESLRQWKKEKVLETRKKLEESVFKENNLQLSIQDLRKEMDAKRSEIEKLQENLLSKDEEIESLRRWRNENIIETRKKLEKENNLQLSIRDLGKEMDEKRSEIEKLEENLLSKEEEIGSLRQCKTNYEVQVSDLLGEKQKMEEQMEIMGRESKITSKCMDDLRSELMVLSSSVDSHVSANKVLERKSSQLESRKNELELHLLELEGDNVGLEDEITRLGIVIEIQNVYLKHKLPDMQSLWLGAQRECENLKMENQKLEEFSESLTEKYGTLQESNGEYCKHVTNLEEKLRETELRFSDCSKRVETLEENLVSMLEDFDFKEKSLTSELDVLVEENRKQKEELFMTESLLDQIENLQSEVEDLENQISEAHDERERILSESLREVSSLRAEKAELEFSLQEVQSRVELTVNELDSIRVKSDLKVQELKADQEKVSKLLGKYRSREEKLKTAINDLELKLTLSEYERQQLVEETANLKFQLQKIDNLQDEVLGLKKELNESKFEKEKLKVSLKSISGEFEELKAEKTTLIEKVSEYENCKEKRIALEEKLLQIEGDLRAREEFSDEDAELKNELTRIKRANKQFQRNIQLLEEEKNEYLKRTRDLEQELQSMEDKQDQGQSESRKIEMVMSISQQRRNKTKPSANPGQTRELVTDQLQVEIDNEYDFHDETPRGVGIDHMTKIELLENELAVALEANNKYEHQLQRFFSEGQDGHAMAPRKSTGECEVIAKERFERTKSSLQTELRDLRDRYFQMSLKYAEVEAEREDLVMKLREAKNGKRWFS